MQLSTRGRYAVMAMVDLASRQSMGCECGPVCLAEIAASQQLSLSYLEQLFAKFKALLRKASARTQTALWETIGTLLDDFTLVECQNYIVNSGYEFV